MTRNRQGFTLTELMIAAAVLLVVILAAGRIFSTASAVTGMGEAAGDVLVEIASVDTQIRADFERLAPEGFFMIRCVEIPNNVNGALLDPTLPPTATVRSDQLIFFINGVQSPSTLRVGEFVNSKPQGTVARIYYGHAFQVPRSPGATQQGGTVTTIDPPVDLLNNPLVPWNTGTTSSIRTRFEGGYNVDDFPASSGGTTLDLTQPQAAQWILARQPVLLVDDADNAPAEYLGQVATAPDIAHAVIVNGRIDAAITQLNDIRQLVQGFNGATAWFDQRAIISSALFYPRAERIAPSPNRMDKALTNHVLAGGCSSIIIDWTYKDGVGRVRNEYGTVLTPGVTIPASAEQPWFGLDVNAERGVKSLEQWLINDPFNAAGTPIYPQNIERPTTLTPTGAALQSKGATVYEAIFGYNQSEPLAPGNTPHIALGYTPWPSSLRITMTLHDYRNRLEAGRRIQFVVDLPQRGG